MYGNDKYGKQSVPLVNMGNGAPHDFGSITQYGKRLPARAHGKFDDLIIIENT